MNPWKWLRSRSRLVQTILLIATIGAAVLGYWLISPLFIVVHGGEEAPSGTTTVSRGTFQGLAGHQASGDALLLRDAEGGYVVRLENFRVTNGPDIHVWLSPGPSATGGVDLGPVKFTEGASNYLVPATVGVASYPYVVIWCNPFAVPFGSARLT